MKYIIMAGGYYPKWETPRQLLEVNGEPIIARTIRLLKENRIKDIAISTNNDVFNRFGLPILKHENDYTAIAYNNGSGYWCNGFYEMKKPACYIFGDVFFSPEAIRTIVEYETDDIMLFGSAPPFIQPYPKPYEEPFAFKVTNQKHLREAIAEVKRIDSIGGFNRKPIAWELWNVISGGDPNVIDYNSYVRINDYTCDIDWVTEVSLIERFASNGGKTMATKKTEKKTTTKKPAAKRTKKPKEVTVIYKDQKYTVIEENDGKLKLTDGIVHFWVKADKVNG